MDELHVNKATEPNKLGNLFYKNVPLPRMAQPNLPVHGEKDDKRHIYEFRVKKRLNIFHKFKFMIRI